MQQGPPEYPSSVNRSRLPVAALGLPVVAMLLAACSLAGVRPSASPLFPEQPSPPAASAPGSAAPTPRPSSPAGVLSAGEAIARQDELDGRRITVEAGYWADGSIQLLSDLFMESYPPQVPRDQSLILRGRVPATILAQLEHAGPGYANVTWGWVTVTGILRAGAQRVPPILELETIGVS
jgi:hypothetical protein